VTRCQFWDLAHWDPVCAVLIFENVVKPIVLKTGEPDQAAIAKGTESFHRSAKVLDDQLKGRKFVTGDTLTLADFSLGASMNLGDMAHYPSSHTPRSSAGTRRCAHCRLGRRRSRNAPCQPLRQRDLAQDAGQRAPVSAQAFMSAPNCA
jgi:glutathione S-transferase